MESSVDLTPGARGVTAPPLRIEGRPAILWVGRLTANKDPLTVLDGFRRLLAVAPEATMTWVFQGGELEGVLRSAIGREPRVAARTLIVGAVPHAEVAGFYRAADLFVSGSHLEGSGYAALEAMACGTPPVLTDIPSFRAMTDGGRVGALWRPGDGRGLARALAHLGRECREVSRVGVRERFDQALSWDVIGRRAVAIYRDVLAR
jgi:glycosyltransferase involved in cell wall biosynthesis